jgi:protein tyrosine phosphatase
MFMLHSLSKRFFCHIHFVNIILLSFIFHNPYLAAHPFEDFIIEWNRFLQSKGLQDNLVASEEYRDYEFALLEEFTEKQVHRHRPYVDNMDRYEEYRPYLDNKVCLSDGTEMSASLMQLNALNQEYHNFIATQAPYQYNLSLFWRMILEKQIDQIVMVTELFEFRNPSKELAYPYWPDRIGEKIYLENGLEITLVDEFELLSELKEKIQIRKMHLTIGEIERVITHYWYRHWMDDSVPRQSRTIVSLIHVLEMDKVSAASKAPILIHCSAGVGRSGVFMTLYHLMQRKKNNDQSLDLFYLTAFLRWQRPYIVAVPEQYKFCYQVLEEFK